MLAYSAVFDTLSSSRVSAAGLPPSNREENAEAFNGGQIGHRAEQGFQRGIEERCQLDTI